MTTDAITTALRRCIGSAKFGIEAHEAPAAEFPTQPSQKDGLGRMCKPHWRAYTNALRKASLAHKAAQGEEAPATEPASVANHSHSESAEAIRANRAEREAVARAIRELAEPESPAPRRSRRAKAEATAEVPADATPVAEA